MLCTYEIIEEIVYYFNLIFDFVLSISSEKAPSSTLTLCLLSRRWRHLKLFDRHNTSALN